MWKIVVLCWRDSRLWDPDQPCTFQDDRRKCSTGLCEAAHAAQFACDYLKEKSPHTGSEWPVLKQTIELKWRFFQSKSWWVWIFKIFSTKHDMVFILDFSGHVPLSGGISVVPTRTEWSPQLVQVNNSKAS